jgi:hypothetical protein
MTTKDDGTYKIGVDPRLKVLTVEKTVEHVEKENKTEAKYVSTSYRNIPFDEIGEISYGDDVKNEAKGNGSVCTAFLICASFLLVVGAITGFFIGHTDVTIAISVMSFVAGIFCAAFGILYFPKRIRTVKRGFTIKDKQMRTLLFVGVDCVDSDIAAFVETLRLCASGTPVAVEAKKVEKKETVKASAEPKPQKHYFGKKK